MRLNKFIAAATGLSRREADDLIAAGRVFIEQNGVKSPLKIGQQIQPSDKIFINDQQVQLPDEKTMIILNKPRGYVSSRNAQTKFAKTLYELLPPEYSKLKTVGRLDKDSSGLILLTDDGDLAQRLTHPRYAKRKTYLVRLDKPLAPLHQQMISDFGVDLPDGKSKLTLTKIDSENELSQNDFAALKTAQKLDLSAREIWRVDMNEGRNRQIRRTFGTLGYEVERLHRIAFDNYFLDDLKPGQVRRA